MAATLANRANNNGFKMWQTFYGLLGGTVGAALRFNWYYNKGLWRHGPYDWPHASLPKNPEYAQSLLSCGLIVGGVTGLFPLSSKVKLFAVSVVIGFLACMIFIDEPQMIWE